MDDLQKHMKDYYEYWLGMTEVYEKWAKTKGLTANSLFTLYAIFSGGASTQSDICKMLMLAKQTVNSILLNFEKSGYVEMERAEADKRNKTVVFTETGARFASKILEELYSSEAEALSTMSVAEREGLTANSKIFLTKMRKSLCPERREFL